MAIEEAGWMARWRVTVGFLAGAVVFWLAQPTRGTLLVGLVLAAAGELLRIWAAGHLEKGREVTQSGPYRLVRHPLYTGSAIMGAGLAIAAGSLAAAVLIAGYLFVTIRAAIATEERFLRRRFGPAYDHYTRGIVASDGRRFSVGRAWRNGEHRAVIGVIAAFLLLLLRTRMP